MRMLDLTETIIVNPSWASLLVFKRKALELKKRGFRDAIDLLLYLTAKDNGLLFLTYDAELVRFLKDVGEDVGNIAEGL